MWVLCKYDTILYKELDHPHGVWYLQGVLEAMPINTGGQLDREFHKSVRKR